MLLSNGEIRGKSLRNGAWPGGKHPSQKAQFSIVGAVFTGPFHTSPTNAATFASKGCGGYTHLPSPTGSHTADHRAKQGRFGRGVVSLPSERFARFGNPARPGIRTAYFVAFGPWSGTLPKNAESLRNSDALMRVAVSRRRGPAGLRRPTPPAERTVLAPISPRVQLCLRRPAFPLSAFIPGA